MLPQLRQLRQRIMLRCKTTPLTKEQTHDYIAERLRIAGACGELIFDPKDRRNDPFVFIGYSARGESALRALAHQCLC